MRYWLPLIFVVFLAAVLTGCGLFSTRDAEQPDAGRHSWETPIEPQTALENMRTALFEHDEVNYLRSFDAENFTFEADNVALANDPSLAPWHFPEENRHMTSLLNPGTLPPESLLFATFTSIDPISPPTDSAIILTPYELRAGVAIAGAPHDMAGTARFALHMGREGYWVIYRWTDQRTGDRNTWSDLKSAVR